LGLCWAIVPGGCWEEKEQAKSNLQLLDAITSRNRRKSPPVIAYFRKAG
jgi:hypothetical protein